MMTGSIGVACCLLLIEAEQGMYQYIRHFRLNHPGCRGNNVIGSALEGLEATSLQFRAHE